MILQAFLISGNVRSTKYYFFLINLRVKPLLFGDTDSTLKLQPKCFLMVIGVAYIENGWFHMYGKRPDVCICETQP